MKKLFTALTLTFVVGILASCALDTMIRRTATVSVDRHPFLIIENQTGFPVRLASPATGNLNHGGTTRLQPTSGELVDIEYFIGGYSFRQQVNVTSDLAVTLTERPPGVTIVNNTGVFITLTTPIQQNLGIGDSVFHLRQSPDGDPQHTVSYRAGTLLFHEQIAINDEDVTLSLTRRPPSITVVNNTGLTITNVFVRNPGMPWGSGVANVNVLGIQLYPDGRLAALQPPPGSLVGSILNTERFTFWTGHLDGLVGGVFDIRLDTHGAVDSFVINNTNVTNDVTLTFTQAHRP